MSSRKMQNKSVTETIVKNCLSFTYKPITQNFDSSELTIPAAFQNKNGKLDTSKKFTQIGARKVQRTDYKSFGEHLKKTHKNKRNFVKNQTDLKTPTIVIQISDDAQKADNAEFKVEVFKYREVQKRNKAYKNKHTDNWKLTDFLRDDYEDVIKSREEDDFITFEEKHVDFKKDTKLEYINFLENLAKVQGKDSIHNIKMMEKALNAKEMKLLTTKKNAGFEWNEEIDPEKPKEEQLVFLNSYYQQKSSLDKYKIKLEESKTQAFDIPSIINKTAMSTKAVSAMEKLENALDAVEELNLLPNVSSTLTQLRTTLVKTNEVLDEVQESNIMPTMATLSKSISSIYNTFDWLKTKFLQFSTYLQNLLGDWFEKFKELLFSLFCIDQVFDSNWSQMLSYEEVLDKIKRFNLPFLSIIATPILYYLYKHYSKEEENKVMGDSDSIITPYILLAIGTFSTFFFGSLKLDFITLLINNFKSFNSYLSITNNLDKTIPYIFSLLPIFITEAMKSHVPVAYEYINFKFIDKKFLQTYTTLLDFCSDHDKLFYSSHGLYTFLQNYNYFKDVLLPKYAHTKFLTKDVGKLEVIDETYQKLEERGLLPGKRIVPTIVWIFGGSGVGKSTLALKLAKVICNKNIAFDKQVYMWNSALEYQDGYNNQPITIVNDYMQTMSREEEMILISMKDGIDWYLNPSGIDKVDLGQKGEVRFTSKLVIITSNLCYLQSSNFIREVNAFNRRRDILIEMVAPEGFKEDRTFAYADFYLRDPVAASSPSVKYTFLEFVDILHEKHRSIITTAKTRIREFEIMADNIENIFDDDEIYVDAPEPKQGLVATLLNIKMRIITNLDILLDNLYYYYFNFRYARCTMMILDWINVLNLLVTFTGTMYGVYVIKQVAQNEPNIKSPMELGNALLHYFDKKRIQSIPSGDNVTMKTLPKRVNMRLKVQGNEIDTYKPIYNKIEKNLFRLITNINTPDRSIIRSVIALSLGDKYTVFPKHVLYRGTEKIKKGDLMLFTRNEVLYECTFDPTRCKELDTDIAIYDTSLIVPPRKDLTKYFLDNGQLIDKFNCFALNLSSDAEDVVYHSFNGTLIREQKYVDDAFGKKFYTAYNAIRFESPLRFGDCGTVITAIIDGSVKILGMHVGGNLMTQFAQYIDKQDLPITREVNVMGEDLILTTKKVNGNIRYCGDLTKPIYLNTKTEIRKTEFFECLQPALTQPCVLGPNDPRNKDKISLMYKGAEKYAKLLKPINSNEYDEILYYLERQHESLFSHDYNTIPLEEAINGNDLIDRIDMNTSAGYPYNTIGLTKKDFFTLNTSTTKWESTKLFTQEFNKLVNKSNNYNEMLWTCCLKDERRPHEKILKPRMFVISNVPFTILGRMIFGKFIGVYMKEKIKHGGCIGINPYSPDFTEIYHRLAKHSYCNDGDYSNFDGTILKEVYQLFYLFIKRLFGSYFYLTFSYNGCTLTIGEIILDILTMACFSKIIVLDQLYETTIGNPSGWFLTLLINEFGNKIYIIYSYLHLIPKSIQSPTHYCDNVVLFTYGDDNIYTTSNEIKDFFNAKTISDFLLEKLGIVYTSGDKGDIVTYNKPISECTFLKNYFVKHTSGVMVGALKKETLQEIPSWTRDDTPETMQMIIDTTLRFAYFWGPQYFNEIRTKLRERCSLYFYMTYDYLDYQFNSTGCVGFEQYQDIQQQFLEQKMSQKQKQQVDVKINKILQFKVQSTTNNSNGLRDEGTVRETMRNYGISMVNQNVNETTDFFNKASEASIPEVASDIKKLLSRPVIVSAGNIPAGTATLSNFRLARLPQDYFAAGANANLIARNYVYFKGKLRAQMIIQSTPYNTGGGVLHVDYSLRNAFDPLTPTLTTNQLYPSFIRPHVMMDFSDNATNKIMDVPWKYKYEYCDFQAANIDEIADIYFSIIAPPTTTISYTLFLWIEDAEVVVTRIQGEDMKVQSLTLFDNSTTVVTSEIKEVAGNVNPSNVIGDQLDMTNDVKFAGMDAPNLPGTPDKTIMKRSGNMANSEDIVNMPKLALHSKEQIISTVDDFGCDEDEMSIDYLKSKWSIISSTLANLNGDVLFAYKTTDAIGAALWGTMVGPYSSYGFPTSIQTKPANITFLDWISRGHLMWRGARDTEGALEYNLHIFSNRFQSGRLAFIFHPHYRANFTTIPSDQLSGCYVAFIDINGQKNEFTFRVPFVSNTPWKYIYNGTLDNASTAIDPVILNKYFCGVVSVIVVTPLVTIDGSPTSVNMMMRVRGAPGYEIAVPSARNTGVPTNWIPTIPVKINIDEPMQVQSSDFVFLGDDKSGKTKDNTIMKTNSIKELCKRFLTYFVSSQFTDSVSLNSATNPTPANQTYIIFSRFLVNFLNFDPSSTYNGTSAIYPRVFANSNLGNYIQNDQFTYAMMYTGFKGSFRFKLVIDTNSSVLLYEGTANVIIQLNNSNSDKKKITSIADMANTFPQVNTTSPLPNRPIIQNPVILETTISKNAVIDFEVPVYLINKFLEMPFDYSLANDIYPFLDIFIYRTISGQVGELASKNSINVTLFRAFADETRLGILNSYPNQVRKGTDPIFSQYNA